MSASTSGRLRAYLQFIAAVLWFFVARSLAHRIAAGMAHEQFVPLVEQGTLLLLLLFGYGGMGFWLERELQPLSEQGWPLRGGWSGEAGLGLALGWALAVICVLPMAVAGGIAIVLNLQASAWGWLLADALFFALAAAVEEVVFRGYGFQRFADSLGGTSAALGFAAFYAVVQALLPGSNRASIAVSVAFSLLLSMAYLRSRALWLSWGLNFAWKASRGLLFGLAVCGNTSHSPVVQGDPMGRFWLTGGGYGLDGSWVAFVVLLAALPVVYRLTRDLNYQYNAPVIVPGGRAVDIDAAAREAHEAAMATPAPPPLVQILPASALPVAVSESSEKAK